MKLSILLVFSFLFIFSCQKNKDFDSTTTVTLTMPDYPGKLFQNFYQRSASAPVSINEINCYAVLVSGPEPFLNRTTCPVTDGVSPSIISYKKYGLIKGLTPAGGTISISVPAGSQRKFTLVGSKASPISACMDFNIADIAQDFVSQLFVLGESSPVDLQPNVTTDVQISIPAVGTAITTANQRLGECQGPDSPTRRGSLAATNIRITKDEFPYGLIKENTCNSINLAFVDELGQNGSTKNTQNIIIERADIDSAGNVGTFAAFSMYSNSNCTGALPTEINIPANTQNFPIFFSSVTSPTTSGFQFRTRPGITMPISMYPQAISEKLSIANSSTASIEILGARRVIANMCYNMTGYFKSVNGVFVSGTAYTPSYENIQGNVFPENYCVNAAIASGTAYGAITSNDQFDFSMRFTQNTFTPTFISLTPSVSGAPTASAKYSVQVVGGTYNPIFLRPDLPSSLPASVGCYGPYQFIVENENAAALVTNGSIVLSWVFGSPAVTIYRNSLCSQSYTSNFFDSYHTVFYVKVNSPLAPGTQLTLRAQGVINHPSTPTVATSAVSLTTTTNLLFN